MNSNFIIPLKKDLSLAKNVSVDALTFFDILKSNTDFSFLALGETFTVIINNLEFSYTLDEVENKLILFLNVKTVIPDEIRITQDKFSFLGEMCANIIHDINNPLNNIIASHELMRFELEDHPVVDKSRIEDYLSKSEQGLALITNIIDGVLSFCRQGQKEMKTINMADLIRKTNSFFKTNYQKNGIRVNLNFKDEMSLMTQCFDTLFLQVIANLLKNSVEALIQESPINRWIDICAERSGDNIKILVKDGGHIDPKLINKVFIPLFTTKSPGSGTGLGLPFCKKIIEAHSGTILIKPECFNTTFEIVIPVK